MNIIHFKPRWKEELEAVSNEGTLIFELTMGQMHVYFPNPNRWPQIVPEWAREQWKVYADACGTWCKVNNIPISFVDDAHVYEEKLN